MFVLIVSFLTAIIICYISNIPMYKPKSLYSIFQTILSFIAAISTYIYFYYYYKFATTETDIIINIIMFGKHLLISELIFYTLHRFVHYNGFLYRMIHKQHHQNVDVVPFDSIDQNVLDTVIILISFHLPVLLIDESFLVFNMFNFVYTTAGILIHSDTFIEHHYLHHKIVLCNYCYLVPIYDVLFGTYVHTPCMHNKNL